MQKLISNREMFRQLLARDILNILQEWNAGTWMLLHDVRAQLNNSVSEKHYYNLHTSKGWSYMCFNDRFYRAIQSINDKGYGLTVRKGQDNKLYVFNTNTIKTNNWAKFISESFDTWTADYNMNAGYRHNAKQDEAVA